jgi:hypothetical protein
VLQIIIVVLLSLTPFLLSLFLMRQAEERLRITIQTVRTTMRYRGVSLPDSVSNRDYNIEPVGYVIGDITCEFNARSSYLRCAINPLGQCKDFPMRLKRLIKQPN